jgi:multidrug efflux pump
MVSHFFIDRPIFATVMSVVITLVGGIALAFLPLAQYPRVTPPSVIVSISYPGASAQVVADSVAAPIEQQVNGVPGMLYMTGQMGNDGTYSLAVTFDLSVDLKTALVMVQNRVALAMQQLPTAVQNQGITIRKKTPDMLMIVNLYSPDNRYDDIYLSNYATIFIKDELLRVDGVSDLSIQGQRDYSIRAWLDPQKLASRNMTAVDVAAAIRNLNLDAPAGQVGSPPAPEGQTSQLPIDALGRLSEPEQFGDIIVKVSGGRSTRAAPAPVARVPVGPGSLGGASPLQAGTSASSGTATGSSSSDTSSGSGSPSDTSTTGTLATPSDTSTTGGALAATTDTTGALGGGGTTGGGGTALGGGTTGGGGTAAGGGTTASGLMGGSSSSSMAGLSINSGTGGSGVTGGGVLSGEALGRGPGRPSAAVVRLRDVARIELGAQNYNMSCTFDGRPSVGLGVFQLPGTNALDVADRVRAKMEELKTRFPDGIDYQIAYDTTPFIRESVMDVVWTLLEAVGLVGLVVLVFLQNWRSVIIPMLAVPVSILGTFAAMAALGYSLNNISLFGLVLAIGIVVDDAIVVVENTERWMERGLGPRAATRKAMEEVTGPIVAVAVVLCAVFVPCAFISGITGQFFRQFAVTIAVSTVFSAFNSLTMSPAWAAILLRPHGARRDPLTWVLDLLFGWFFKLFSWGFRHGTTAYAWGVGKLLRLRLLVLVAYGVLMVLTVGAARRAPTGFVPQQDQGRLICNIQLPDAASLQRTQEAVAKIVAITRKTPGVAHTVGISGMSFLLQANSPNFASMFIVLDPFEKRQKPELRDTAIMAKLRKAWAEQVKDANVTVFGSSPIPGIGVSGGFKFMVEDRGGLGLLALQEQTDNLIQKLKANAGLSTATTQFRSKIPQIYLDIDRTKAAALGVSLDDVNQTLDMYLGSLYVTSYNAFGRHWQVTVQAEGQFRDRVEDVKQLQVRNKWGQMVLLGTLVTPREVGGPISVTRYNLYTAASVNGNVAPDVSTGDAIKAINEISADTLPLTMKAEWTDLMFMQIRAGNTAMYVFALSIVSVFLALSALYESWTLPLAVILVVPLCLLCSVAGVLATNRDVNIFVQIGLVVLVGLACKNAILIVEFARQMHQAGTPLFEATREASRLRLRPILMTSFAFIIGVVPLMLASGAGAEMRRSLGTAVFSGMLGVTLFGVFLTPVFFYVIQWLGERQVFARAAVQWVGSAVLGGGLGVQSGFLIGRLGVAPTGLAMAVGGVAGALTVLAVLGVHRSLVPVLAAPAQVFTNRLKSGLPGGGRRT